jgi:hypothetical protein
LPTKAKSSPSGGGGGEGEFAGGQPARSGKSNSTAGAEHVRQRPSIAIILPPVSEYVGEIQ